MCAMTHWWKLKVEILPFGFPPPTDLCGLGSCSTSLPSLLAKCRQLNKGRCFV